MYKWNKKHKRLPFTDLNIQDIDCAENKILKYFQLESFEIELVDSAKDLSIKGRK